MKLQNHLCRNVSNRIRLKRRLRTQEAPRNIRNFASTPGVGHICSKSQLLQFLTPSQPFAVGAGLLRGCESNRIDDHQK
jgi:hypothetical protein